MNEIKFKELKGVIEFCKIVGNLKKVERTGWTTVIGIQNPESVAEHIYRTAVIAMVIGDLKGLDTEKMMRMALIHDLTEALTGDWDQFAKKKLGMDKFKQKEDEAIKKIMGLTPENLRSKYLKLWNELVEQKSEEAKLVMELDKIELIFQAYEYGKEGHEKKKLEKFWNHVEERINDADIKKIFESLKKERS